MKKQGPPPWGMKKVGWRLVGVVAGVVGVAGAASVRDAGMVELG
jgi:hypothetical protein